MVVRIGMAPRLPGLTIPEFQAAWRSGVAERLRGVAAVRRYVQNHALLRDGRPVLGYPGFDGCAELTFDSTPAMFEALEQPAYADTMRYEAGLIDRAGFAIIVGEPHLEGDDDLPESVVKLIAFLRRHPGCSEDRFRQVLLEGGGGGALRREVVFPDPGAHAQGRPPATCEAAEIRFFADAQTALSVLAGSSEADLEQRRAGVVFGAVRVLARPLAVI
jgi:hypothetical protein